jgi:hypothetical protein
MRVGDDNSPTVYRSVLRPTGGKVLFEDTAFYTFDEGSGTLKIARQPLMADEVIRYDVNGKAFCYTVAGTCVSVTSDQKGVKRILFLGCTTGYAFYDEDGDGILEKLDLEGDPSRFKLHIPEWVAKSH